MVRQALCPHKSVLAWESKKAGPSLQALFGDWNGQCLFQPECIGFMPTPPFCVADLPPSCLWRKGEIITTVKLGNSESEYPHVWVHLRSMTGLRQKKKDWPSNLPFSSLLSILNIKLSPLCLCVCVFPSVACSLESIFSARGLILEGHSSPLLRQLFLTKFLFREWL